MNPSRVRWGVTLILIGGIFLAINLGRLSWWIWADLLRLWPVLLIAIGLEVIVRKSKVEFFGYISTIIIIASVLWVIYDNGGFDSDSYGAFPSSRSEATVPYNHESNAVVDLKFTNGRLYFNSDDAYLLRATAENSHSGVSVQKRGDQTCQITISAGKRSFSPLTHIGSKENHWKCYLHPDVRASIKLDVSDADLRFFGQDLQVDTMNVDADHTDMLIKLGKRQNRSFLSVTGRSSDLNLFVPDSSGLRVEGTSPSQVDLDSLKLTNRGGYFANDLYDIAPVNFQVKSDLGSGRLRISIY